MASTTRPGRPWRNTAPLCAPPEVRQPYGPGCGHPQSLTPPSEGPAAGGRKKAGESPRAHQLPLSVKPWQVTANASRQVTANASAADPCQTFWGDIRQTFLGRHPPDLSGETSARPFWGDIRQTFLGRHLPDLSGETSARPFTCQTFWGDTCQTFCGRPLPAA
jgi:hypothetical protein